MKAVWFTQSDITKTLIGFLMAVQLVACGGGGGDRGVGAAGSGGSLSIIEAGSPASQVVTSSVSLQWTAPVARADNTPLSPSEIAGYRIYYGSSEGDYPYSVDVSDGASEQVILSDLPLGTYYFVLTTYDTDGRESMYSTVVMKSI